MDPLEFELQFVLERLQLWALGHPPLSSHADRRAGLAIGGKVI
jgi:hypothetical protein